MPILKDILEQYSKWEKGAIVTSYTKKKLNLRSFTESELIGVDNKIIKMVWMKHFMEWQGFPVKLNIIYQDNTRSKNLE